MVARAMAISLSTNWPMKFDGWDETFDTYQTLVVIDRPQDGEIDYTLQPQ